MELRKLRSLLSARLSTRISLSDLQLDQYKGSKYTLGKFLRRNSLDSSLRKLDASGQDPKPLNLAVSVPYGSIQQTMASPRKGLGTLNSSPTQATLDGVYSPRAAIPSIVDQHLKLNNIGAVNEE